MTGTEGDPTMQQKKRSNPSTTRLLGGTDEVCSKAGSRYPSTTTLPAGFVKGKLPWRSPAKRLPHGFNTALHAAFSSRANIRERVNRIRFVLEDFNQTEDVLPTKIHRFIKRFGRTGGVR